MRLSEKTGSGESLAHWVGDSKVLDHGLKEEAKHCMTVSPQYNGYLDRLVMAGVSRALVQESRPSCLNLKTILPSISLHNQWTFKSFVILLLKIVYSFWMCIFLYLELRDVNLFCRLTVSSIFLSSSFFNECIMQYVSNIKGNNTLGVNI